MPEVGQPYGLAAARSWTRSLDRAAEGLVAFCRLAGEEFETIGTRLFEFQRRIDGIARDGDTLAGLLGGEDLARSTSALSELPERFRRQFESATRESQAIQAELAGLVESLRLLRAEEIGLERLVRTLRILGLATRVQTAGRPDQQEGFGMLATEVMQLAATSAARLQDFGERRAEVDDRVRLILTRMRTLGAQRDASAGAVIGDTVLAIGALIATHERAAVGARTLVQTTEELQRAIGAIVVGMQFHDITRQELEHAVASLRELAGAGIPSGDPPDASLIATGAGLQAAQVAATRDRIVSAVDRISHALRDVARLTDLLAENSRTVAGIVGRSGTMDPVWLEGPLKPALARLDAERDAARDVAAVLADVVEQAAAMSEFLCEIEQIGSRVQLIALNARITASHTGRDGAALEVIAEAIQAVSTEARLRTERTTASLGAVRDAASAVRGRVDSVAACGEREDAGGASGDLASVVASLEGIKGRLSVLVCRQEQAARALVADIASAVRDFRVPHLAGQTLGPAVDAIAQVANHAGIAAPEAVPEALVASAVAARYTTDGERTVYGILSGNGPTAAAAKSGDDDLGDNIELF